MSNFQRTKPHVVSNELAQAAAIRAALYGN